MSSFPPFLAPGEDDVRFYAIAYCQGQYDGSPEGDSVFLTLYFTTAPDFTRFSLHIVNAEGYCFTYMRGVDEFDLPEYALLNAWATFQVPPATWRLFPLSSIPGDAWPQDDEQRTSYFAARDHLCRLFYHFRIHARFSAHFGFTLDPGFAPPSIMEESDETREIMSAMERSEESRSSGWDE
jgi:hypothetical protein